MPVNRLPLISGAWLPGVWLVGAWLALIGPGLARAQDGRQALTDALARAERDPAGALQRIEALLAAPGAGDPALEVDALRARAQLLVRVGRRGEGEAVWRALLGRGDEAAAPALLALLGARLEARLMAPARPGAPARVAIAGAGTGPLTARLYALDLVRWRAQGEADPGHDLLARLRAPPAGLLRNLASWDHPGFPPGADGRDELRTPPLAAGAHLLVIEARGVPLAVPLLVSRARALVRRGAGPGLVWWTDARSGAPLPGLELLRVDATGRVAGPASAGAPPLAPSDADGLSSFAGQAGAALAWLPAGPDGVASAALVELPPEAPPVPPAPLADWPELPAVRAGARAWRVVDELAPGEAASWSLGPPALQGLLAGEPRARRGHAALLAPALPAASPPGEWRLLCGPAPLPVRVRPAAGPFVRLELQAPDGVAPAPGEPLAFAARALLPDDRPLPARRLVWQLLRHPAGAPPRPLAAGPLPPHARLLGPARPQQLAAGELRLDARGEARWVVPAPALLDPALVSAHVRLAEEPDGLRGEALRLLAWAPAQLHLELIVPRETTPVGRVLEVGLRASRPDGAPVPDLDLELLAAPETGPGLERRALRTGPQGVARGFVTPDRPGPWRLEARLPGGPAVRAGVLAIGRAGEGAPAGGAPRLVLEARHEEQPELVLVFPGVADGPALLLLEGAQAVEAPPRLLELRGGAARVPLTLPDRPVRALALVPRDEAVQAAALDLPPARPPLTVRARVVAWPAPDQVELAVEVSDPAGRPAPALVTATLFPPEAAPIAARLPGPEPVVAVRVRGDGDRALPAPPPPPDPGPVLEALASLPGASAGADAPQGQVRLRLPVPPQGGECWVRVRAAADGRGESWLPVRVAAPLEVRIAAPTHLCVGDRGALRALVQVREPGALPAGTTLRLTWSAEGLDLGRPHVEGARVLPGAETGPESVVVEVTSRQAETGASPRLELTLPLSSARSGPGRVILGATLVDTAVPPLQVERRIEVREPGWSEARCASGRVEPGPDVLAENGLALARITLDGPRGAVPRSTRLQLAFDPGPATALLDGQARLLGAPGAVAGLAARWVDRAALRPLLEAQRLRPARPPAAPPPSEELFAELWAARAADGGWGPRTGRIVELLQGLRAAGEPVPRALLEPALAALPPQPPLPPLPPGDDAWRTTPATTLLAHARAELARGKDVPAAAALAAASARADELRGPGQLGELLRLQGELLGRADAALVGSLLATRQGPGWDDPLEAAHALLGLGAAALAGSNPPAARLRIRFQDDDPHGPPLWEAWSGGGLREWSGPFELGGNRVAGRPALRLEADAPAAWAARVEALVRPPTPLAAGLSLGCTLRAQPEGEPVGAAGVSAGETVWLEVRLGSTDGRGLAGALLELPLPAGTRPLALPAGGQWSAGVLRLEAPGERLLIPLLALDPGDWTLPPARLQGLSDPERQAWSAAQRLRIR